MATENMQMAGQNNTGMTFSETKKRDVVASSSAGAPNGLLIAILVVLVLTCTMLSVLVYLLSANNAESVNEALPEQFGCTDNACILADRQAECWPTFINTSSTYSPTPERVIATLEEFARLDDTAVIPAAGQPFRFSTTNPITSAKMEDLAVLYYGAEAEVDEDVENGFMVYRNMVYNPDSSSSRRTIDVYKYSSSDSLNPITCQETFPSNPGECSPLYLSVYWSKQLLIQKQAAGQAVYPAYCD